MTKEQILRDGESTSKLYLSLYNLTLVTDYLHINYYQSDRKLTSCREVRLYNGLDVSNDTFIHSLEIDERYYNTLHVVNRRPSKCEQLDIIISKFNEFKKSNPGYGNYSIGDNSTYEGSKPLYLEDFFDFLKTENRNLILSSILNK